VRSEWIANEHSCIFNLKARFCCNLAVFGGARESRYNRPAHLKSIASAATSIQCATPGWHDGHDDAADRTRRAPAAAARLGLVLRPGLRRGLQARRTGGTGRHPDISDGRTRRCNALLGRAAPSPGLHRRSPGDGGMALRLPEDRTTVGGGARQDLDDPGFELARLRARADRFGAAPLGCRRGDRRGGAAGRLARTDARLCAPGPRGRSVDRGKVPHSGRHRPSPRPRQPPGRGSAGHPLSRLAGGDCGLRFVVFDLPRATLPPDKRRRALPGIGWGRVFIDRDDRRSRQAA
jgi:hypothetical protein